MNRIDRESVLGALASSGFVGQPGKPALFLVKKQLPVAPAFYCVVSRRRGELRLGGGLGLFFRDFESIWSDSLSAQERRIDATLPLIMLIDNYPELDWAGALRYTDLAGIARAGRRIHDLACRLPDSLEAFDRALVRKELLGRPVSDYLHIFDYHENDNLYFRKSVRFVCWFMETWPQFAKHMRQCLTDGQLRRLGLS